MLSFFVKFFSSLNTNSNPGEIAHGISIALILGFLPKDNVFWYVLFIFFLFVRINKGAFMLFTALFAMIAPEFDYIFDEVGYYILTLPQLQKVYTSLMNIPFVGFTKFNNTIVMGAFICSLVLYIPLYFISRLIVFLWRNKISPIIQQTKIVMVLKNTPIIQKISDISEIVDKVKK